MRGSGTAFAAFLSACHFDVVEAGRLGFPGRGRSRRAPDDGRADSLAEAADRASLARVGYRRRGRGVRPGSAAAPGEPAFGPRSHSADRRVPDRHVTTPLPRRCSLPLRAFVQRVRPSIDPGARGGGRRPAQPGAPGTLRAVDAAGHGGPGVRGPSCPRGQPTARVERVVAARSVEDPGPGGEVSTRRRRVCRPHGVRDGDGLACWSSWRPRGAVAPCPLARPVSRPHGARAVIILLVETHGDHEARLLHVRRLGRSFDPTVGEL